MVAQAGGHESFTPLSNRRIDTLAYTYQLTTPEFESSQLYTWWRMDKAKMRQQSL